MSVNSVPLVNAPCYLTHINIRASYHSTVRSANTDASHTLHLLNINVVTVSVSFCCSSRPGITRELSVKRTMLANMRTVVQIPVRVGHRCEYELRTFSLAPTAPTSPRLTRSVK